MRFVAPFLVITVVLAGCGAPATPVEEAPLTRDVETGPDLGAISGVVVDASYTPIAGASVAVTSLGLNLTTDPGGTFVIPDLPTGTYFIEARADRFLAMQHTVNVEAGVVAKPIISLPADPTPLPYHHTITFSGHMTASDIYVVYILTYELGNTTLCECIFTFAVEPGYETAVLQGDWTPTVDLLDEHPLYWEIWGGEGEEGYDAAYLNPEQTLRVSGADFGASQDEIWVQVSSSEIPDVEQPFDGYLTFFYGAPAPDGWSFME